MDVEDALDWELLHGRSRASLSDLLPFATRTRSGARQACGSDDVSELLLHSCSAIRMIWVLEHEVFLTLT